MTRLLPLLLLLPLAGSCMTLEAINTMPSKMHKLELATGCRDARYTDWDTNQGLASGCGQRWVCRNDYHYGVLLIREETAVCRELKPVSSEPDGGSLSSAE